MALELGLIPGINGDNSFSISEESSDSDELDIPKVIIKSSFFNFLDEDNDESKLDIDSNDENMDIDDNSDDADSKDDQNDILEQKDILKIKEKKKKKQKQKPEDEVTEKEEAIISYGDILNSSGLENIDSFSDMNLSRPILKALNTLNWSKPTPIQSSTIPTALMGNDICACAATGTGKTGAFMIPILERLIYKPNKQPITRVLVLTPTRELAVQIFQVSKQIAQFTKIDFSLSAGGLDRNSQEATLRMGPDVVIATLGRLIDHLHNAPTFNLNSIEILVLDEADRMLDEYFAEQMKEVLLRCSKMRQTMLFSATMTEKVKDLATLSLKNPTKIFVNENREVALNLHQEFIRIRPNHEADREAIIAALVKRTFHSRCIIFIQTKKEAHRLQMILSLLGINVGELHGNLNQSQRLDSLKKFKEADIDVLIATDLVARGLDIEGVKTVINLTMPSSVERYIHRVGRTARAGKAGRSITLVGEKERNLLVQVIKMAKVPVKMRTLPTDVVGKYREKIKSLENRIKQMEMEELQEKEFQAAEKQANHARNIIEKQKEDMDMSQRKRTWFQTPKERIAEQKSMRLDQETKKKKSGKSITAEERVEYELQKAAQYSARAAKRNNREKRIRAFPKDNIKKKKSTTKSTTVKKKSRK